MTQPQPAQRHLTMAETIEAIAAIGPVLADPGETDLLAVAKIEHRPNLKERRSRVSKGRVFAAILAFTLPFAIGGVIEAHDAMSGWAYPRACCSDFDCYEIAATDIEPVTDGWRIKATGEVILFSAAQVSGDGRWHRCSHAGDRTRSTICLFVPAGG